MEPGNLHSLFLKQHRMKFLMKWIIAKLNLSRNKSKMRTWARLSCRLREIFLVYIWDARTFTSNRNISSGGDEILFTRIFFSQNFVSRSLANVRPKMFMKIFPRSNQASQIFIFNKRKCKWLDDEAVVMINSSFESFKFLRGISSWVELCESHARWKWQKEWFAVHYAEWTHKEFFRLLNCLHQQPTHTRI